MQMKKYVLLLVIASLALAMPNYEGTRGLFRTISADNGSAGTFGFGFYLRGFMEDRVLDTPLDAGVLLGDSATYGGGDIGLAIGYAPTDWFSFNVSTVYYGDGIDSKASDTSLASTGIGDTKLGLKFSFGNDPVNYGLYTFVSFPTGADRDVSAPELGSYPIFNDAYSNPGGAFRYFSSDNLDYGAIALFTAKMGMLQFDLNAGYVLRNGENGGLRDNATVYGAALSYHTPGIIPFIELSGVDYSGKDQFITFTDDSLWGYNQVYLTPGVSFRPSKNFHVNFAVDFRVIEDENTNPFPTAQSDSFNITQGWGVAPSWAAIFGFSYTADFIPEVVFGDIAGRVLDGATGDNLVANIGLFEQDVLLKSLDSDATGQFKIADLDPGVYTLKANAVDYEPYEVGLLVKAGEVTPVTVALNSIPKTGTLIVNIIDIGTKEMIMSNVTVGEMAAEMVPGRFEKVLDPGTYRVRIMAEDKNYLPYERTVNIEAGKTLEIEAALVKKEFKIVLPEVYFEFDKSNIKPESYPVLDGAAKTIKTVFEGNAAVKIEVQGHTDSKGSDAYNLNLSNERAGSVKQYLVLNHNLNPDRLLARGYGESRPVTSNDSDEGRAKNRRVEFVVIE